MQTARNVYEFSEKILGDPFPLEVKDLTPREHDSRAVLIVEEYCETMEAMNELHKVLENGVFNHKQIVTLRGEVVDGIGDLIYVLYGYMHHIGVNGDEVMKRICAANMAKIPVTNSNRAGFGQEYTDVVKPEGWEHPCFDDLVDGKQFPPIYMSPAFVEATELRAKKARDYGTDEETIATYFPLGDVSYAQMIWMKALRIVNFIKLPRKLNFEGLRDSIIDLLNYASFWIEHLNRKDKGYQ